MEGLKDRATYVLLKVLLAVFYVVSHVYDYLSYPIYLIVYHPWRVRRYKRSPHARREDRDDCVVYHSLQEPGDINAELARANADTLDKVFSHVCDKHGDRDCFGTREILAEEEEKQPSGKIFKKYVLGQFHWISYAQFRREATAAGAGLRKLGVRPGDRVAVLAETRADWMVTAFACFQNNIAIVTLYTNLGNDGVKHALTETEVPLVVCSAETLPKVRAVCGDCPALKTCVVFESQSPASRTTKENAKVSDGVDSVLFRDLIALGKEAEATLPAREPPTYKDVAIIMYTSGSTGAPKGVMLSHRNLVAGLNSLVNVVKFSSRDRYIGYLPLAHVLELLAETACLTFGIKIGYSSANTLTNKSSKVKAGCKGDANLLRPTLMCAVPLILERIYKSIVDTMKRQGWAAEELFHYFVRYKMKWADRGFDTPLLNKTLFRKIRYFVGGRVRLMLSGGAPLSPDTHSLTRTCICVPVMQGYGLTETTASCGVTSIYDRTTGRVGAPLMNVKVKLVDWAEGGYTIKDKPYPRGEIHVGGDIVATGYFKNEEKTAEEFYEDEDGVRWFRTGDVGEMHDDGVMKIVDRKKDLVKLQQGEYVSYGKVESLLKTCPVVENVCLYADPQRDYLVGVVIPDKKIFKELVGADASVADPAVAKKVQASVAEYGKKNGLQPFEVPAKLVLTDDEWSPDTGMVTAAFKIRRREIVDKYRPQIDKIYT